MRFAAVAGVSTATWRDPRPMRRIAFCLLLAINAAWLQAATPARAEDMKNVLVLYGNTGELPWVKAFDASLRSAVEGGTSQPVNFYTEYFDVARFPAIGHRDALVDLLRTRYADRNLDLIILGGGTAFDFLMSRRARLFPDVPLVYSFLPPDKVRLPLLPPGVFGVPVDFAPMPTIELALRLHPHTKRLVMVTGAAQWDRAWEKRLRAETSVLASRLDLEFLAGLPTADVLARLSALPPDTVVYTPGYFQDGAGAVVIPRDVVEAMAARSTAPVYVQYETFLGTGAVGGFIPTFDAVGRQTGTIAAALLEGKPAAALNLPAVVEAQPLVDWRQIRRWGIDDRLLSSGTDVRYREPTLWDQYWREASAALAIVLLQFVLIAALLIERRLRRQTTAELKASERRMDLAARAAKLTTWTWDFVNGSSRVSPRRQVHAGGPTNDAIPQDDVLQEVHPADRERVKAAAHRALAANEELDIEYRTLDQDGHLRWIALRGRRDLESDRRLLGVALDVTERKAVELQAAGDRAALRHVTRASMLGQLSASIAHELNQPLAAIGNNAETARKMLAREPVNLAEIREIFNDIVTEDRRAADVIRRLRALFRRDTLQLAPVDINELIRDTVKLVHTDLLRRRVDAFIDLAPSLPPVEGGRVELQQALLNLIVNAADAIDANGNEVERKIVISTATTGDDVRICVEDSGQGIASEELENIFKPFYSTKAEGMGMGLAICRSIVAAHHGTLSAANNPDRGASFSVTLPAAGSA